jgi:hypothetical protein
MEKKQKFNINTDVLDKIIVGRIDPHIYAFTTETVPNYLKVGDTYRPIMTRINEWKTYFPNLEHIYTKSARIDDDTIFRDYSVHKFLESDKHFHRLQPTDIPTIPYYSNEFFEGAKSADVDEAIADILDDALKNSGKYTFYTSNHLPRAFQYTRGESFEPRDNQKKVIENFKTALNLGRKNLLMYAVMRFGKSFTSMCCAKEMNARLVLVVSAKADVKDEWKKTVESIGNFEGYSFATKENLLTSKTFLQESIQDGKRIVLFLTLQDLQGEEVKEAHKEVFASYWDLLLVDETHFGARAEHYGAVLSDLHNEEVDTLDDLDVAVKELRRRVTIHLSGTPYRILMGSEFEKEDIIAFVQFSDIADAQARWIDENKFKEDFKEWENPYFGFPQMVRFAFRPNKASLDKIESLRESGATTSFSELFRPVSLAKSNKLHKQFTHEDVVLDLLKVIDGSKDDENVLGFLNNQRIQEGKLCHHMVFVLPYRASCDAMCKLLESHKQDFKNLSQYEIINISGFNMPAEYNDTANVKRFIADCENSGKRTITLTVNRMLTGNTVPQWDTMIFFKQTSSPEEYDQAIYRLQNPFVDEYVTEDGERIKYNMKPQTLLVDFDSERVFKFQERKSQIYNINIDNNGNSRLRERIETELCTSPIITLDHNKLREVTSANIIDAVRNYAQTRSIIEEAEEVPVDITLLENAELKELIESLKPIDSKNGFVISAHDSDDNGDDIDAVSSDSADDITSTDESQHNSTATISDAIEEKTIAKKFASYYALILFFSFITDDIVESLEDIINVINASENNRRISKNLGLSENILRIIQDKANGFFLSNLDYKIQNTNSLNRDTSKSPIDRVNIALTKFCRISDSEVVTPAKIVDKVVSILPDTFKISQDKILDIASKQGEFLVALLRRYGNDIGNRVYCVCTSKVTYEFTRKVYTLLSLPIDNIFNEFTSYDLIKPNNDYTTLLKNMNFSAVIGNPPYQEEGLNTRKPPIYHLFYDVAFDLSDKVSLITPARFLFKAGQTPMDWMEKILSDKHFKVVDYSQKSTEVFPTVDIKGGVAITYRDANKTFGQIGLYSEYNELRSIVGKVYNHKDFHQGEFSNLISSQGLYKFTEQVFIDYPRVLSVQGKGTASKITSNSFENLPEIFKDDTPNNNLVYIEMIGRIKGRRVYRWIRKDYIKSVESLDYYKVLVPEANGTGAIGEVLSTPIIGMPMTGHTDTFLSVGCFDSLEKAENCLKYIKTKFSRTMLGTLKATQHNPRDTWANVPLQDFSSKSDIDWSKEVSEIDRQLYTKYGLTDEEIAFIESMIKPM